MSSFSDAYAYLIMNWDKFIEALQQHLLLVIVPLTIGLFLGLPLGLWSARSKSASILFLNGFNGLRVIPSLAVLFLAVPILGLNFWSAILALTLLVMPPILISTDVAFRNIDPAIKEAALGMGMTSGDVLTQVEIPLALPVVLAGIKTATVEVVASATLSAFIGAGGLGSFIVLGFAAYEPAILLIGAIPVALLAITAEMGLDFCQRVVQPPMK